MTLRTVQWLLLVCSAIILATKLAASEAAQDDVLSCFNDMGTSTEWNQCLNRMFAPCADKDVGSSDHLGCLSDQRDDWRQAKLSVEADVISRLTEDGMTELSGLMLAWPKFVEDKCEAVAQSRAQISYEAAALGCQISELALLTNEMTACLAGRSAEAYCQLREQ